MTRSILCGLLSLFSVVTIGLLPAACQSGGVGDPCTPEDEYNPDFAGFKVTEENIESRSFQCTTRICLVNHFQGRVSCPLGQDALDSGGARKSCNGPQDTTTCGSDKCVEASTLAPDCDPANPKGPDADCGGVSGTHCDKKRKLCTCISGGAAPAGFFCGSDSILKSYACHKTGACQSANATAKDNAKKDCCVPGTDTPVVAPVCGQCATKSSRNAEQAVYCSCRCLRDICTKNKQPDGSRDAKGTLLCDCTVDACEKEPPADPNANYCDCPTSFLCTEIRKNVGLGDAQLTGSYCIKGDAKSNTAYSGDPFSCGEVQGHFDSTCRGTAPLSPP